MPNESSSEPLPEVIHAYYERGREVERLSHGAGKLEFARTCEIILRCLPAAPAVVLDVGGGPGEYACWLAREGHEVHLTDPIPLHVEQAREASAGQTGYPIASCELGDARRLAQADQSMDVVLLLGPLYHLTERSDRVMALQEARRVLRPGGHVIAAAISRFASTLDGAFRGFIHDPEFAEIVRRDLADGQHRNPNHRPGYFTTAYFHHADELKAELEEAGLSCEATLAVEGFGWLLPGLDEVWSDSDRRETLLSAIRSLEAEPTMLGVSAHLIAIGRKQDLNT